MSQVGRVQNDLVNRLATAFSNYAAARQRADRYRTAILPKAQRTYELSLQAYQGGQFEYLRVLEAQRAVGEARLELVRALGEMWDAASEIAGLMLEDQWPLAPAMPQPGGNNQ
jgi:cobalt-zinc-cadmium efflux system outer membrane protein